MGVLLDHLPRQRGVLEAIPLAVRLAALGPEACIAVRGEGRALRDEPQVPGSASKHSLSATPSLAIPLGLGILVWKCLFTSAGVSWSGVLRGTPTRKS